MHSSWLECRSQINSFSLWELELKQKQLVEEELNGLEFLFTYIGWLTAVLP